MADNEPPAEQEAKIVQDIRYTRPSGEPNQDGRTPSGRLP